MVLRCGDENRNFLGNLGFCIIFALAFVLAYQISKTFLVEEGVTKLINTSQ